MAVVSGRVDDSVKERAGAYIRAAGYSTGDVVKAVWEHIAATGEVPLPVGHAGADAAFEDFVAFCDELPAAPEWLATLGSAQRRDMVASRYA